MCCVMRWRGGAEWRGFCDLIGGNEWNVLRDEMGGSPEWNVLCD